MPRCVLTGSDTLSVFSVFVICGAYATSDIPSLEAPRGVGGRDHHRGEDVGAAVLFGVWFPEERGSSEGQRGGEVLVLVSISPPFPPRLLLLAYRL